MLIKLVLLNGKFVASTRDYQAEGGNPEEALRSLGASMAADINKIFPPEAAAEELAREEFALAHPGHKVIALRHQRCGHDALHAYLPGHRDLCAGMVLNEKCPACGGERWTNQVPTAEDTEAERKIKGRLFAEADENLLIADLAARGLWKALPPPSTPSQEEEASILKTASSRRPEAASPEDVPDSTDGGDSHEEACVPAGPAQEALRGGVGCCSDVPP